MFDTRVKVGNIHLQIQEFKQTGPPIIFLHFGGGNLMMWQRVIPFFQAQYHLVLVDLRDHGKSDKPQMEAHIDDMARDILGLMQVLNIKQSHIVGSSLGAEVGLSLAAKYPEKVISLVCEGALYSEFGPYGIWEGSEETFKEYAAQTINEICGKTPSVFTTKKALVEANKQIFEKHGWWNQTFNAFFEYNAFEIKKGQFVNSWQNLAKENYLKHYFEYRFEDYYQQVQCPVLLLPGEEEFLEERKKTIMLGLLNLTKHGRLVLVPGWVHPYGWLLDPEGIVKIILSFINEYEG